jgi:3-phenylpropionate/trans-cinnamate dioxygenase ferredoxin subunit
VSGVDVGALEDFADGAPTACTVEGRAIVIVRLGTDVYALQDRCSHEEFPLSQGEVDSETAEIECERHGAMFRLADGEAVSLPATKSVPTFPVSIEAGRVMVVVS